MVVHAVHVIDNSEGRNTHDCHLEKLRLIRSNADGPVEREVKERETYRVALVEGCAKPELAANGRPITKIANGRLHLHLLGTSVFCNGTALSVLSRGVVVRAFRDALDRYPQNPCEAISRDGSSARSVGCLELREVLRMHNATKLNPCLFRESSVSVQHTRRAMLSGRAGTDSSVQEAISRASMCWVGRGAAKELPTGAGVG